MISFLIGSSVSIYYHFLLRTGGLTCFYSSKSQFTSWKNGCCFILDIVGLLLGLVFITYLSKSWTSVDNLLGNSLIPSFIFRNRFFRFSARKGGVPIKNSYKITPRLYTSADFPDPDLCRSSGAKYAGEPQKDIAGFKGFTFSLASPKSASFICPILSSKMFSGFKSLYTISNECRYSMAKMVSAR